MVRSYLEHGGKDLGNLNNDNPDDIDLAALEKKYYSLDGGIIWPIPPIPDEMVALLEHLNIVEQN